MQSVLTLYFAVISNVGGWDSNPINHIWYIHAFLQTRTELAPYPPTHTYNSKYTTFLSNYKISLKLFTKKKNDEKVFAAVWPSAWRSGIGHFMSYGLIQASGVLYAQVASATSIASYLLTLRLIQMVSAFSQAPFYSKLPAFARLFAEDKKSDLVALAKKGMRLSHWCYVAGFIGLGISGEPLLKFIGSNAEFPTNLLWSLMGLAFFVERYGAMHLQLYSITNHIIWHIANGFAGIIYIIVCLSLFNTVDVYAFPLGLIAGYVGFYAWYSAMHSYKIFGLSFMTFEKDILLIPFCIMAFYFLVIFLISQI